MRVLVFTRTTGYRHESIGAGVAALTELARDDGATVRATEDPGDLTVDGLRDVGAVVFLNTSGEVLGDAQRAALTAYLGGGGGFAGVHCAAHTEPTWPFYGELVGARFVRHPEVQPAEIRVADRDHPATSHLADPWPRVDEWYDFERLPEGVRILLRVDEASYTGGAMGADHPLAWCREIGGGRSFYTALGHTSGSYDEPALRRHLWGGIRWAAACKGTLFTENEV
jgi:hypothetical protein